VNRLKPTADGYLPTIDPVERCAQCARFVRARLVSSDEPRQTRRWLFVCDCGHEWEQQAGTA